MELDTHLKRNNIVAATIPVALWVTEVVPAKTAMHAHCPAAAKSISFLCTISLSVQQGVLPLTRPIRSISQMGMSDDRK